MKSLVSHLGRIGLLALVVVVLASTLTTLPGAQAASPSYTLSGYVVPPAGSDWSGVQVDLVSQATGAVYTTTTSDGAFSFTYASTGGVLAPGYWGLWVPAQGNITGPYNRISSCVASHPCAVLPATQTPVFSFYSGANLTVGSSAQVTPTLVATVATYSSTVSGYVNIQTSSGMRVLPGTPVQVLDPQYAGLVLYNTTSNWTTGAYSVKAPAISVVLQATDPNTPNYVGTTNVTLAGGPYTMNVTIQSYVIYGQMQNPSGAPIGVLGNVTLFDPSTGYLYTQPVGPTGRYIIGTYGKDFGSGTGTFDLFLSAQNYTTVEYTFNTAGSSTPVNYNVRMAKVTPAERGNYNTTVDLTRFNNATGTGVLWVNSTASLGSNAVVSNLPNQTVSMLWAQLALDYNHTTTLPASLLSSFYSYVNSSGPVLPAAQAYANINSTGFLGPSAGQNFSKAVSACNGGTCGPTTTGGIAVSWSNNYTLNGTVRVNSSLYSVGFNFRHPSSSADIYNYTVLLPKGYVLKAGTSAPSDTSLYALGVNGTWSTFSLTSWYDPSNVAGNFTFTIVSATTLTAIVNVTVPTYFAFSSRNVLNSTVNNYTVEVGINQNVTFSAFNTIYPSGISGVKFAWTFGDGTGTNVTIDQTYHYYRAATASAPDKGTLTVVSSNNIVDTTKFFVWVASGPTTAAILSNASTSQNRTVGSTPYLFINWGTVLYFNATASRSLITPTTTAVNGTVSVAAYTLVSSRGFSVSANYSESSGAWYGTNWTYQFLGAGYYLTNGTVNGNLIPFKGWQYNLTLKVWSGTGQTSTTTLVILVNDTEKPVSSFNILNSAGSPVSGKSVIAQSNLSAQVQLNASGSSDPHNGSIVRYYWLIGLTKNGTVHIGTNVTTAKPFPKFWLTAQVNAYWVNLTVFDLNGNSGYSNQTLTVAANSTTTPILAANNLTGPAKLSSGGGSTYWVNVTVGGGSKSTALDVQVTWYTTAPGGTTRSTIAGTPGSVTFYNYTSAGVVNTVAMAHGSIASLSYNTTVRAVISWTPSKTGNFQLYANATASNEFQGDYSSGTNVASTSITVNPNPTTQLLEYIAIGVAVVAVILAIVFFVRRRGRPAKSAKTTGKSGLERGGKRSTDEDEEDDES